MISSWTQNIVRLARGIFEYVRKSGWGFLARRTLILSKMMENQIWGFDSPFYQFTRNELDYETMKKLNGNSKLTPERIRSDEYDEKELGFLVRNASKAPVIRKLAHTLPHLQMDIRLRLIGAESSVLEVTLEIKAPFVWNDYYHGKSHQNFWIWMEEPDFTIVHHDIFAVSKKQANPEVTQKVIFKLPFDPKKVPSKYVIHTDSDLWLGCEKDFAFSPQDLLNPEPVRSPSPAPLQQPLAAAAAPKDPNSKGSSRSRKSKSNSKARK